LDFSNFGSLKSTETRTKRLARHLLDSFSNFGSLKSTETVRRGRVGDALGSISAISAR